MLVEQTAQRVGMTVLKGFSALRQQTSTLYPDFFANKQKTLSMV